MTNYCTDKAVIDATARLREAIQASIARDGAKAAMHNATHALYHLTEEVKTLPDSVATAYTAGSDWYPLDATATYRLCDIGTSIAATVDQLPALARSDRTNQWRIPRA